MDALRFASMAALLCVPLAGHAQSFRCRNDLVRVGATRVSVLQKCGEPAARDAFCRTVYTRNANGAGARPRPDLPCENVEEWTDRPGYGQLITTLRFEEGRLVAIGYGDR